MKFEQKKIPLCSNNILLTGSDENVTGSCKHSRPVGTTQGSLSTGCGVKPCCCKNSRIYMDTVAIVAGCSN